MFESRQDFSPVYEKIQSIKTELKKVIIGQEKMVDYLLIGLLAGGHVLLEGYPGLAKTLAVKLLSRTLDMDYKRIQFTPDLMPSDIVGTSIFNFKNSEFEFRKGPVFANFILADEINRAPAKTQSALFEVMEERQVSVEGYTFPMDLPFFIIGTQNPIDLEGTYRLPEAQLDRFLLKINIEYPSLEEEQEILKRFDEGSLNNLFGTVEKVVNKEELKTMMASLDNIVVDEKIRTFIANIVHLTRQSPDIIVGGSPRASLSIMNASKALAMMSGRDFVVPDDVVEMAIPALVHRIILNPEKEMEGSDEQQVIESIIRKVEVPK
jgi:MoxR-like ATPase